MNRAASLCAGVAVTRTSLTAARCDGSPVFQADNDPDGMAGLVSWLTLRPALPVMTEASGSAEACAIGILQASGLRVGVITPRVAREYLRYFGLNPQKSPSDAPLLASLADKISGHPQSGRIFTPLPNVSKAIIIALIHRRMELNGMLTSERLGLTSAHACVRRSLRLMITALEGELQGIENEMEKHVGLQAERMEAMLPLVRDTPLSCIKGSQREVPLCVQVALSDFSGGDTVA